jgi:outer membrane protein assembly factor BamB
MQYGNRLAIIVTLVAAGLLPLAAASAAEFAGHRGPLPAVSAAATRLWAARYHSGTGYSAAEAVAMSPDGSLVYVTGYTGNPGGPDGYSRNGVTVAYDAATGARVWTQQFSTPDKHGAAVGNAVTVSPDGSTVFVTGTDNPNTEGRGEYVTVAYNAATGTQLWQEFYSAGRALAGIAIAVSPDGSAVFVTGNNTTVAYDAATGARLWAIPDGRNHFTALTVSPDGSTVFAVGDHYVSKTATDYMTVALDTATGATRWTKRYEVPDTLAKATSVAVSPDGSAVYVTGQTSSGSGQRTLAYNASTGATLWSARSSVAGTTIVADPDAATVFMTGSTAAGAGTQVTTALSAATGARVWVRGYDPANTQGNYPVGAAVSSDGSMVLVAGNSDVLGSTDHNVYTGVAYNASTGAALWSARFGQEFGLGADSMAAAPDGSELLVTGSYSHDYETVAWHAPA